MENNEQKHKQDLEAAKGWLAIAKENNNKIAIQILEKFFPELKENENENEDEKIRKSILELVKQSSHILNPMNQKSMIAWLEKQGEQKPYPETLDKAIELYYYSYGNGKDGFDNLSLEQFKDIIKTFVEDYGNKSSWSEEDEDMIECIIAAIKMGDYYTQDELNRMTSWLKDKSRKVVARDGKEVEICLTEFEKELEMMMVSFSNGNLGSDVIKVMPKQKLHNYAHRLLDLARKEIEEGAVEFAKSYMEDVNPSFEKVQESEELWNWKMSCLRGINKAYKQGKQDALKDVPKWKRNNSFFNTGNKFELGKTSLRRFDGYEIPYSELEKLPKEE